MKTRFSVTMTDKRTGVTAVALIEVEPHWRLLDGRDGLVDFRPNRLDNMVASGDRWIMSHIPPRPSLWSRFLDWVAPITDEPIEPDFVPASEISYYSGEAVPPALRSKWGA